ncbi:MAG: hypothetical protein NTY66_02965 [Candidatus Vogelbacteria bacterium]|nr:hypothetical protein [Candidatus Vogelbacteria bacterium]
MRKLITIIIVLVLLGLGGYYLFARKTNSPTGETTQTLSDFAAGSTSSPRNIGVINNFFRQNEASSSTTDSSGAGSGVTLTGKFSSLTKNPVAGANILTVIKTIPATKKGEKAKTETQSTLWYLDKATGNLFQISLGESLSAPEQGSVTALSGIEEAIFGSSGDSPRVLARRQKDSTIETLLGRIVSASSSAKELESTLLESGIYSIVRSPDTLRYAYLVSGTTGSIAYLANFSSPTAKKQFFTSAFPKWQISWPSSDLILFQSAPSFTLPGSIYAYNLKTNSFTKIIGGISGLTGLSSPDGKKIVYSGSDGLVLNLSLAVSILRHSQSETG